MYSADVLFDLTPYSKDIVYHPDWEDMQGEDDGDVTSSHVEEISSHVEEISSHVEEISSHVPPTCEQNQPTCELRYQWVEIYPVKQEFYYYRYSYIDRSAQIQRIIKWHIPGGCTTSSIAINRMAAVEAAIRDKVQPPAIEAMIKAWRKHSKSGGDK